MWNSFQTTAALAQSRSDATPLAEVRAEREPQPQAGVKPTTPQVATFLEALTSVIPTGIIAAYSGFVVLYSAQAVSVLTSAERKAAVSAEFEPGDRTKAAVAEFVATLPKESADGLTFRYVAIALGAVAVLLMSVAAARAGAARAEANRVPVAEPVVALVAFVAWALAGPGTPLAAQLGPQDLFRTTVLVAFAGALLLPAASQLVLSRPARKFTDSKNRNDAPPDQPE